MRLVRRASQFGHEIPFSRRRCHGGDPNPDDYIKGAVPPKGDWKIKSRGVRLQQQKKINHQKRYTIVHGW